MLKGHCAYVYLRKGEVRFIGEMVWMLCSVAILIYLGMSTERKNIRKVVEA